MKPDYAISVTNLTKRYRNSKEPANDRISLNIIQGEFIGVMGPNGAGKTTLVRQLTGLTKPTSGEILVFGKDIARFPDYAPTQIGYFGQRTASLRNYTFEEVVEFTGRLKGQSRIDAQRQSAELIARFEAELLADSQMRRLSGGEQRLALLLSTFIASPRILVLDEPTNELDPVRRRILWSYLHEQRQSQGTTVLLTTHNLAEAEKTVEKMAVIHRGVLSSFGTPGELKRKLGSFIRLDVRTSVDIHQIPLSLIPDHERYERISARRFVITTTPDGSTRCLQNIVDTLGWNTIDDLQIGSPSLEEAYIHAIETSKPSDAAAM